MRKLAAGAVSCAAMALALALAGCGGSSSHPVTTATNRTAVPADFSSGYEHAWGEMKRVAAEVNKTIKEVKRAQAKHRNVANSELARKFAIYAAQFEPAVIEFQGLTPPASVAPAFRSMAAAAAGVAAAMRSFSTDANANRASAGAHDLASYYSYAVTVDNAALTMYNKLGLK
jgi:hypothetical protein